MKGAAHAAAAFAAAFLGAASAAPSSKADWEQAKTIAGNAAAAADEAKLPRVLILGDSISLGYTPIVKERMKGKASVRRPSTNCGPSSFYLNGDTLGKWVGTNRWDVIHVNFGIWDNHYLKGGPRDMDLYWGKGYASAKPGAARERAIRGEGYRLRTTVGEYERNLRTILTRLKATGAKVVFALTTPMQCWEGTDQAGRINCYNEVAQDVCAELGVAVNDLHRVAMWRLDDQFDGCHFRKAGYSALADAVIEAVEDALHPPKAVVNVLDCGANGEDAADDSAAFQKALDTAARPLEVVVPRGRFYLDGTVKVGSDTTIRCARDARILLSGARPHKRGEFLLTNRNKETGDRNIRLLGGNWDGNNGHANNQRAPWDRKRETMTPDRWSGVLIDFRNVKGLVFRDLNLQNPHAYYVRMCVIDGFDFRRTRFFSAKRTGNQDGFHWNGFCRNGFVEDTEAWSGQTDDDLFALNADDILWRDLNYDMVCGPIENVTIRNLYAPNCCGAIRLLSVESPIRNVRFENIVAGNRCYFVNADAARYCASPIFRDEDRPNGVGCLENITFENCRYWVSESILGDDEPLFCWETNMKNVALKNVTRDTKLDRAPKRPDSRVRKCTGTPVTIQ